MQAIGHEAEVFSEAEAAVQLGVARSTLRRWREAGNIEARKGSKVWEYAAAELDRFRAMTTGAHTQRRNAKERIAAVRGFMPEAYIGALADHVIACHNYVVAFGDLAGLSVEAARVVIAERLQQMSAEAGRTLETADRVKGCIAMMDIIRGHEEELRKLVNLWPVQLEAESWQAPGSESEPEA